RVPRSRRPPPFPYTTLFRSLGQLLSSRADLLPPAYIDSLARLQDEVEPFSFSEVERVLSEELGVRRSRAFSEFEPAPLAAASLGDRKSTRLNSSHSQISYAV